MYAIRSYYVLIFSSFVQHLELVAKAFTKRKWKYAMLTGSTTNREEEITRFADDENIQAFLISLKAGGVGLNLTQADYIFIIDPWWNPAAEMQAIGREHRIGQQKQVMAYRFITQDSIEEKMMQLQAEKRNVITSYSIHYTKLYDFYRQLQLLLVQHRQFPQPCYQHRLC